MEAQPLHPLTRILHRTFRLAFNRLMVYEQPSSMPTIRHYDLECEGIHQLQSIMNQLICRRMVHSFERMRELPPPKMRDNSTYHQTAKTKKGRKRKLIL